MGSVGRDDKDYTFINLAIHFHFTCLLRSFFCLPHGLCLPCNILSASPFLFGMANGQILHVEGKKPTLYSGEGVFECGWLSSMINESEWVTK